MKSFDSRTYSVNDFVEWSKTKQLELNPQFQRRSVWSEKAKSYLIDTIFRGKPIPKIFIRQKLNVSTKTSIREVVDGQQRLRAILSFVNDGFAVSKRQNEELGGLLFTELPEDTQEQVLNYELSVDLLINMPNSDVLDIFSRLNSYTVVLNEQEKLNAKYFGAFKMLADEVGHKYGDFFQKQGILTAQNVLRMQEVNLVADLFIAMLNGIKSKKQIARYYDEYEEDFEEDTKTLKERFDKVISKIGGLYPEGLANTEFKRPLLFYSLFTAIVHCLYGVPSLDAPGYSLKTPASIEGARNGLDRVDELFEVTVEHLSKLSKKEQQFRQDCQRATTDEPVRERRTRFLLDLMG